MSVVFFAELARKLRNVKIQYGDKTPKTQAKQQNRGTQGNVTRGEHTGLTTQGKEG